MRFNLGSLRIDSQSTEFICPFTRPAPATTTAASRQKDEERKKIVFRR